MPVEGRGLRCGEMTEGEGPREWHCLGTPRKGAESPEAITCVSEGAGLTDWRLGAVRASTGLATRQPHPQPVSHQPRGHRVEHAAQREAARARHPHQRLLEAVAAPPRQRPQHRPFRVDPLPVAGVAVAYHLAQERPVLPGRLEIPRAPQQQRILDRPLQVPVRTLDRTVLVARPRLFRLPFMS